MHRRAWPFIAAFLTPAVAVYAIFIVYSLVASFRYSLYNWTGLGDLTFFVGARNYEVALWESGRVSELLWNALWHNILFFAISMALVSVIGLGVAFMLTMVRESRAHRFEIVYFLPMVIPPLVVAYLWGMYLDPTSGALAQLLGMLGLSSLNFPFLGTETTALATIAVIAGWASMGYYIFIFLPSLNDIPAEITDAARVDGAGSLRMFFSVIFPIIKPTYITVTALVFIASFGLFDFIFILQGAAGGPNFSTDVLGTLFFRTAFGATQGGATASMSLAAAMAIVGFVIVMIVSGVLVVLQRRAAAQL